MIIDHYNHRIGYQKIFNEHNIPISTIRAIIWRWNQDGLATDLPWKEHSHRLSEWTARSICQDVIQNPLTTLGELQKDLLAAGTEVSKDTISQIFYHGILWKSLFWIPVMWSLVCLLIIISRSLLPSGIKYYNLLRQNWILGFVWFLCWMASQPSWVILSQNHPCKRIVILSDSRGE